MNADDNMNNKTLAMIANKDIDEKALLLAINQLDDVNESPDFWNDIASDPEYNKPHRGYCINELFKRHIKRGITLSELVKLLNNPCWLDDKNIEVIKALRGEIPVEWNLRDTIIRLQYFPELKGYNFIVYLRLSGQIYFNDFIKLLRNIEVDQRVKDAVVIEVGFIEPLNPSSTVNEG